MSSERRAEILLQLYTSGSNALETDRLGQICASVVGVTGAGLMLMSDDVPRGSVGATDDVSQLIEDLQFTLGEGPCIDAHRQDRPILEPDLADPETPRWLGFSPPAVSAGARALFGFPLQVGSVRLGALNLYRDRPGALTDRQYEDALVMADVAAQALLIMQTRAPAGSLGAEIERGLDLQNVVHQAAGMVAAQIKGSVGQALIRLRAHAFSHDRALVLVAEDIVARRLRFSGNPDDEVTAR